MLFEGSSEAFERSVPISPDSVYTPKPICDRAFVFRNETMAEMSDAEIAYVRLDEQSVRYPYNSALRKSLARLEAIATICVDGVKPDLATMLSIEAATLAESEGHPYYPAPSIQLVSVEERNAALAAIRYNKILDDLSSGRARIEFDGSMLLELHKALMYDDGAAMDVHFRRASYKVHYKPYDPRQTVYFPPDPDAIPDLMDDLMAFCHARKLSPVTQAAVAHFQLEAIRPFKTGMDRTGRAFVHAILRNRGFYKHIIPPIALVPAMNIPTHAMLLFPYRTGVEFTNRTAAVALDRWTLHCAKCVVLSVDIVEVFMRKINAIERSWYSKMPEIRKGSAVDILLHELPGTPIVSVGSTMTLTGKGFSAANEAVGQLVKLGILRSVGSVQRNRCFEAPEIIDMFNEIIEQTIPDDIAARESFCDD